MAKKNQQQRQRETRKSLNGAGQKELNELINIGAGIAGFLGMCFTALRVTAEAHANANKIEKIEDTESEVISSKLKD